MSATSLEKMLDALTSAYCREDLKRVKQNKLPETHIGRLFALFASRLDTAEQVIETLRIWDSVENAAGKVLDRHGNNFGVKREGTDDEFYRLLIQVKMIAQLSGGDIDTVVEAAASLFQVDTERIQLVEVFPAKVRIYIEEDDLTEKQKAVIELIAKMLKRVVAAGVGFKLFTVAVETIRSKIWIGTATIKGADCSIRPVPVSVRAAQPFYVGGGAFEESQIIIIPKPPAEIRLPSLYVGAGIVREIRMNVGHMKGEK